MARRTHTGRQAVQTSPLQLLIHASRNARRNFVSGPLDPYAYPELFEVVRQAAAACRLSHAKHVPFYWRGVRLTARSTALGIVRVYRPGSAEVLACSGFGASW